MSRVGQNYGPTAENSPETTNSMLQLIIIMAQFPCQDTDRRKTKAINEIPLKVTCSFRD